MQQFLFFSFLGVLWILGAIWAMNAARIARDHAAYLNGRTFPIDGP